MARVLERGQSLPVVPIKTTSGRCDGHERHSLGGSRGTGGGDIPLDWNPPCDAGCGEPATDIVNVGLDEVSWSASPMFLGEGVTSASEALRRVNELQGSTC